MDARPAPFTYGDGTMPSNRRQAFDATFGLEKIDPVCLHKEVLVGNGANTAVETREACAKETGAIATFDDSDPAKYWSADNPWGSTKVAGVGVKATVVGTKNGALTVSVTNPKQ